MSESEGSDGLRVAVVTRTGRLSGVRMACAIHASGHVLCGILAERRLAMVWRRMSRRSAAGLLRRHGAAFLLRRLAEWGVSAVRSCVGRWARAGRSDSLVQGPQVPSVRVWSLNGQAALAQLDAWAPDVIVVANAPVLVPEVVDCARLGALNFHSGRLPEFGGVESEFWALYRGETNGWATIHRIAERLDSGVILAESPVPIVAGDTPDTLHERCVDAGCRLVVEALDRLARGDMTGVRDPGPATLLGWPTAQERRSLAQRQ